MTKRRQLKNKPKTVDIFIKRLELLAAASAALTARETSLLATFHPDDAGLAYMSAEQNAFDTMIEKGRLRVRESSFAYRKMLVATLLDISNCAEDYGFRRAAN